MVAAIAIVLRIPLLFDRYDDRFAPDSGLYLKLADTLLGGLHYPDDYRVPGYPSVIALLQLLPGRREDVVVLFQHALGVALAVAILLAAWRWFGRSAGILAGVAAATTPVFLNVEHDILPDLLFTAAVFGATAALAETTARRAVSTRTLILLALLFALTAYIKPNGQAFVVAAFVPLAIATRDVRRTIAGSAVFAAVFIVAIVPWMARNSVEYHHFSMSAQGGESLFLRVFDQDHRPIPTETPDGRLAARVHAEAIAEAPPGQSVVGTYSQVKRALIAKGMTSNEATAVQGHLATTAIRRDPTAFVLGTVRNVALAEGRSFDFPLGDLRAKLTADDFPRAGSDVLWLSGTAVNVLWVLLAVAGLAAVLPLFVGPRQSRIAAVTLAWIWLIVAGTVAVTNVPSHRLSAQVLPELYILGSAGIVAAARFVRARGTGLPHRR